MARKSDASGAAPSTNGSEAANTAAFGEGDLGRLQQILLGDHARQAAERMELLEQALMGAVADLRRDVDRRFDELTDRVEREAAERNDEIGRLKGRATRETNARNELATEMHQNIDTLESRIGEHLASLRDSQVDRLSLSALLSDAASALAESGEG